MKQSSTEPPKKKLKQARLPFQILSPPLVKNCEDSPSLQCKRKACEATSDDDVVVSEINENKITPVEKKAKVINKDKDKDKRQSNDGQMEVGVNEEGEKKTPATKRNNKKASNAGKKNITPSNRKSSGKNSSKVSDNEDKSEVANTKSKPVVVDVIDLCDSPVKIPVIEEPKSTNKPKHEDDKSVSDTEGIQLKINTDLDTKYLSIPSPASKKTSTTSSKLPSDDSENVLSGDDNTKTKTCEAESSEKVEVTQEKCDSNEEKDSAHKSKSNCSDEKYSVKNSLKQASIKNLVTTKSPKPSSPNNTTRANHDESSEESDANSDDNSQKSDSNNCMTPLRDVSSSEKPTKTDLNESDLKTPTNINDSVTKGNSPPSSECDTSSLSTPGTDPVKKISKTARRMTPKQLLKLKEKEEKRIERERLKEEKEKKKAEEKEEKLKLKKEKEEERLKLKQEKEDEKRKEKEEKEKKKQAELEQKNEEKRLKEEEKRQKEEEKRVKEEEKRKRDEEEKKKKEEKRLKEEQKEAEKRKSAQAFASFFVKNETKPGGAEELKENTTAESNFQPFEVKNDMRLAPVVRTQIPEKRRHILDSLLENSSNEAPEQRLYLDQIRSPKYVCGSAPRTWPPPDETDDEVIIIESEKPDEDMEVHENEMEKKPEKKRRRAKLLQFHENRRPPYWGTWRKKSKYIRPRAPLNQDKTMLEYEVDSDDEWEEPEEGESLRGSEDEESQDEQYEEDNDMFVPHGYLSDGEGEDELDDQSPEAMKARLKLLQMEFEAERSEKQEKLKPRLIGCVWFCNSESNPTTVGSRIAELFLLRRAVWEGSLPLTVAPSLPSSPSMTVTSGAADTSGNKKKLVKESLVPDIIRKVHGSRRKLSKLLLELLEEWNKNNAESLPSKNCLAKKIRELAVWERPAAAAHHCWYVKEDVRRAYGLTDLDLPPPPSPVPSIPTPASITKFTKVLTTDERLKLLREPISASKELPKEASKPAPSTPSQNMKPSHQTAKTPTVKLGTSSPVVKKRVTLFTIGPKESPKQNASTSIMNFVTKSAKSEESQNTQSQGMVKVEEKVKKRITPITLTTSVSKPNPPPPSSEEVCIILDD